MGIESERRGFVPGLAVCSAAVFDARRARVPRTSSWTLHDYSDSSKAQGERPAQPRFRRRSDRGLGERVLSQCTEFQRCSARGAATSGQARLHRIVADGLISGKRTAAGGRRRRSQQRAAVVAGRRALLPEHPAALDAERAADLSEHLAATGGGQFAALLDRPWRSPRSPVPRSTRLFRSPPCRTSRRSPSVSQPAAQTGLPFASGLAQPAVRGSRAVSGVSATVEPDGAPVFPSVSQPTAAAFASRRRLRGRRRRWRYRLASFGEPALRVRLGRFQVRAAVSGGNAWVSYPQAAAPGAVLSRRCECAAGCHAGRVLVMRAIRFSRQSS